MKKIIIFLVLGTSIFANNLQIKKLIDFNQDNYKKLNIMDELKATDEDEYTDYSNKISHLEYIRSTTKHESGKSSSDGFKGGVELRNGLHLTSQGIRTKSEYNEAIKKSTFGYMELSKLNYDNDEKYLKYFGGLVFGNNKITNSENSIKNSEYTIYTGAEYGKIIEIAESSFINPYIKLLGGYVFKDDYKGNNLKIKEKDSMVGVIGSGIDYKIKIENFSFIAGIGYNFVYSNEKTEKEIIIKGKKEKLEEEKISKNALSGKIGVEYIINSNIATNITYEVSKFGKDKTNKLTIGLIYLF